MIFCNVFEISVTVTTSVRFVTCATMNSIKQWRSMGGRGGGPRAALR